MTHQTNLHLPDCPSLSDLHKRPCDCGTPPHPLPADKAIVRRYNPSARKARLIVIPRSKLKKGEANLVESRL